MGRSVTSHSGEGIHKTEVQWADQLQIILVKESMTEVQWADCSGEGIHTTEVQWADRSCEGIDKTEVQQADQSQIVLMKGSIRQRYSGQISHISY